MARSLAAIGDDSAQREIASDVVGLCRRFPIYPSHRYLDEA
jgi:hypothetical protein